MVEPHFTMLWSQTIPRIAMDGVEVTVIAGKLGDAVPPSPPPRSFAARPDSDVAIWTIKLAPHAEWTLPTAAPGSRRTLYFFRGSAINIAGSAIAPRHSIELREGALASIKNGADESELLLLQGRPIGEKVVQYGPFVMNSPQEIQQAFTDYRRTQFGGWPWQRPDPVHPRGEGRFARHADGRIEKID
jgi:hypothetical protein